MQSLQKFIQERLDNFYAFENLEVIDDLYDHLCIEYDVHLNEARGIPDEMRGDAMHICQAIQQEYKESLLHSFDVEIPVADINFYRFNRFTIVFEDSEKLLEGYIDWKECKNKNYVLHLKGPVSSIDNTGELTAVIGHELLHIYTYEVNNDKCGKSQFLQRLERVSYDLLFKKPYNSSEEEIIKNLIYYTQPDEVNAFIAQITLEIESASPANPQEAIKLLHKNDIYMGYLKFKYLLDCDSDKKQKMCQVYRGLIKDAKDWSDKQIFRHLRRRLKEIYKRFNKILPRLCYEAFKKNEKMIHREMPRDSFIYFFERYSREYHLNR